MDRKGAAEIAEKSVVSDRMNNRVIALLPHCLPCPGRAGFLRRFAHSAVGEKPLPWTVDLVL